MKRKLNKEEKEATLKAIEQVKEDIINSKQAIKIYKKQIEFTKLKRRHEDLLRPFNQANEDKQLNDILALNESNLKIAQFKLENLQNHIKDGVEVKNPSGVS